jgi:hypothetical protein
MSAEWADHRRVSYRNAAYFPFSDVLAYSELTVKTLLMEVFTASTPTSSGNYKAFLETLPAEYECDTPRRVLARF